MEKENDNYGRFFALLRRMPGADKEELVHQFTKGRTTHLHLMSAAEYDVMCNEMERVAGYDERKAAVIKERKRKRSLVLREMTRWGVDTKDWGKVNAFCENPRISGKEFRKLDLEDLETLFRKLKAMNRKREAEGGRATGRTGRTERTETERTETENDK